jgi:hypothetical protein
MINYRYDRIGNMLSQVSDMLATEIGLPVANLGDLNYGGAAGRHGRDGRLTNDAARPACPFFSRLKPAGRYESRLFL